ncbi:WYL domain-containing protein [Vibrio kanaloae]|uniref:helix-turn-helix transcriptional regulator n=1 Tax=Vibrio kanaloae TaxID=170673 RepID=UPI0010BF3E35|nr:WYL domain-containing protein [Vibrio kanaloae]TKF79916.1 WYL domain-containing protein [Vibrio kanaloae]
MNKSEKLAYRLSQILSRLHSGEKLSLIDLQQEFGVHERTVLRDFSRLAFLPIEREDGYYFLKQLDHRNPKAHLALNSLSSMGVDKLFPDRAVMTQALSHKTQSILFRHLPIEDSSRFQATLRVIANAIHQRNTLTLTCQRRRYHRIEPYQLINEHGIWHLVSVLRNQSYSFRVSEITELVQHDDIYTPSPSFNEKLIREELHWNTQGIVEVIAQVGSSRIDDYQRSEQPMAIQVLKELGYGSTLISIETSDIHALMPVLKSWLPDIDVISPSWVKQALVRDVEAYLATCS